jgi:hypothetical protein
MSGGYEKGRRVYSKSRKQYGVLTSDARRRTSDFRPGLTPPWEPGTLPLYDVRFDNNDTDELVENDLEPVLASPESLVPQQPVTPSQWDQASAWATKHAALLTFLAAIFAALLAAVVAVLTAK